MDPLQRIGAKPAPVKTTAEPAVLPPDAVVEYPAVRFRLSGGASIIGQRYAYMADCSLLFDEIEDGIDRPVLTVVFSVWTVKITGRNLQVLQWLLLTCAIAEVAAGDYDVAGEGGLHIENVGAEANT